MNPEELKAKRARIRVGLLDMFIAFVNDIANPSSAIVKDYIDRVLNNLAKEGVGIIDEEAELPPNPYPRQKYGKAQQDMLKAGYIKSYPLREKE